MRYRVIVEHEDGTFRVLEDTPDKLKEYEAEEGETLVYTRTAP